METEFSGEVGEEVKTWVWRLEIGYSGGHCCGEDGGPLLFGDGDAPLRCW